jgi:hypothetical protein
MTPDDFIAPRGEISATLFPADQGSALVERVQAYITKAGEKAASLGITDETVVERYTERDVYARLYDAVVQRMANTPATSIADEGSVSYSAAQMQVFADLRDEHAAARDMIVAGLVVVTPTRHESRSIPKQFTF